MSFVDSNNDYLAAIAEFGFDHETARRISENTADQIPMPDGEYKFAVMPSAIEGHGIIATSPIARNEIIGPARINDKRTPLGRYTNHAKAPNAIMVVLDDGDVNLVASKPIQSGQEVTIDYRQAGEAQKVPKVEPVSEVSLSDLAGGLERAARDICKYFSLDPNEPIESWQFFFVMTFTRWQLVAEQLMASIEASLPSEARPEFRNLALKAISPEIPVYH